MKKEWTTLRICHLAMCIAIGAVLEILASTFKFAQGGSISLIMVPVVIIGLKYNIVDSIICGIGSSLIDGVITNFYYISFLQFLLDYVLPFAFLALGVVFVKKNDTDKQLTIHLILGIILGFILRYACHVAAGVIFYGEYAPENQTVWAHSLIYNVSYLLPAFIASAVVTPAVVFALRKSNFFIKKG